MDKQYLVRDDHIGIFKNFMPDQLIEDYINYFNKCEQQGAVYPRKEDEMLVSRFISWVFIYVKFITNIIYIFINTMK